MKASSQRSLRSLVRLAAGAIILLPLLAQEGGLSLNADKSLVGTWQVAVTPNGAPSFRAYNQFNADGTSIEFDNANPPGQQTIAVGPWKSTGERQYQMFEVNQLFDPSGNYQGELHVSARITLDSGGNTFDSSFTVQVFDNHDNLIVQAKGTAKGKRLSVS